VHPASSTSLPAQQLTWQVQPRLVKRLLLLLLPFNISCGDMRPNRLRCTTWCCKLLASLLLLLLH
jgi:hypothetical protein